MWYRVVYSRFISTLGCGSLVSLILIFSLSGCSKPEAVVQSAIEADPLATANPELVFQGMLNGQPVHLMLNDCKVFRAQPEGNGWQVVLEPDPYPFFTSCVRQTLQYEFGAVTVMLGRMAFGAGGCCATGGRYRSSDGQIWKKL